MTAGINNITGTVATAGNDEDFNALDGYRINRHSRCQILRPAADIASEFGGTFSLSAMQYDGYVGWFGAERRLISRCNSFVQPPMLIRPQHLTPII